MSDNSKLSKGEFAMGCGGIFALLALIFFLILPIRWLMTNEESLEKVRAEWYQRVTTGLGGYNDRYGAVAPQSVAELRKARALDSFQNGMTCAVLAAVLLWVGFRSDKNKVAPAKATNSPPPPPPPSARAIPPPIPASSAQVADFMTVEEAARQLGVSEDNVLQSIWTEDLKATKVGPTYRIARAALEEFRPR